MSVHKALIFSLVLHLALFGVLQSGFKWRARPEKNLTSIEAKLMIKDKRRSPDLLPRKHTVAAPKVPAPKLEKVVEKKPEQALSPPPKPVLAKPKAPKANYAKELARLSQSFAEELAVNLKEEQHVEEMEDEGSYFDQIYSLIKKSFVVPPHINGPQGQNLMAIMRLYLSSDGSLARLNLEQSSGDEHFDKAVMDGTRRVNNFGAVPVMLQSALSDNGVLVEMCPFKCAERRGG